MLQATFMRCITSILFFIAFTLLSSTSNSRLSNTAWVSPAGNAVPYLNSEELQKVLLERRAAQLILGRSQQGRNIEAFFFPGTSHKRALIIGGMHGSELSSIEVAKELLRQLSLGDSTYYNVIIIPSLFPDNAEHAKRNFFKIGGIENIGRYSYTGAVDPNRQMPTPGYAFDGENGLDHAGRKIENENALLLELINEYQPQRIVNLHSIRTTTNAGIFADPRTDHRGIALGYSSDSSLAIAIARAVQQNGGYIPGNRLHKKPTAVYYKDPAPVAAGLYQKRNYTGSPLPGQRGGGVSLGTWAATAVCDDNDPSKNRDAIRIITLEFPGSKRPIDHKKELQPFYQHQVKVYAMALKKVFLGNFFTEEAR